MPQPSLISGVAGTVHSEAYQGPGVGEQMMQMAEAFSRVKAAKEANAQKKLESMIGMVGILPIDEKAIRKTAKEAGYPLASDDTISAIAAASKGAKVAGAAGASGASTVQPDAKAQSQGLSAGGGKVGATKPDVAAAAAHQKWQDNMTPDQGMHHVFDTWVARSRQLAETKFKDEKAKMEYNTQLTNLKTAALAGDSQAAGKLMAAGEVPFNISQLSWQNATDDQKKMMYGLALGHETEAQKMERETTIFNSLLHNGMNASDAYGAAHAMASGQPLSPDQQKKMGTPSIKQLSEEASFMQQALELGVPADQIQSVATTAHQTGSLITALPKALQPVFQRELELRSRAIKVQEGGLGVERDRTKLEGDKLKLTSRQVDVAEAREKRLGQEAQQKHQMAVLKMQLDETKGANKEYLDTLKAVIGMQKNGVTVDSKVLQKALDGLKSYSDNPEELMRYLSGQPTTQVPGGNPVNDELK